MKISAKEYIQGIKPHKTEKVLTLNERMEEYNRDMRRIRIAKEKRERRKIIRRNRNG